MKAVVFDMDGVLVDSEPHWKRIEHGFLSAILPSFDNDVQEAVLGLSMLDAHTLLRERFGLVKSFEEFESYYRRLGPEVYRSMAEPMAGGRKLLSALAAEKIPLALVSSSPQEWIQIVLARFDLGSFFQLIISAEELHMPGKPSPYIYNLALQRLEIEASFAVAIEDTAVGVASAKAAGMCCVGLCPCPDQEAALSRADLIVRSLEALSPAILRSLVVVPPPTAQDGA